MPEKFALGLIDPFDENAKGSKVPDMYSFPTDTLCYEQEFTIKADASGNFDFSLMPHPLCSIYTNNQGAISGGAAWGTPSGTATDPKFSGLVSSTVLSSISQQYRVVAVGMKMETLMIPTSATGQLTLCQLPAADLVPIAYSPVAADRTNISTFLNQPTLDSNGLFDPGMRQYATGHTLNGMEFQSEGISCSLKIVGASAFDFKDSTNNSLAGLSVFEGDVVAGVLPTTTPQIHRNSYLSQQGWSNLYVRGKGFPVSSNVSTLRVIMHLEYIEDSVVNGSGSTASPVSLGALDAALNMASTLPWYRSLPRPDEAHAAAVRLGIA